MYNIANIRFIGGMWENFNIPTYCLSVLQTSPSGASFTPEMESKYSIRIDRLITNQIVCLFGLYSSSFSVAYDVNLPNRQHYKEYK